MTPRLVNAKELAQYLGTTEGSIYTYKSQGKIPPQWIIKLGKRGVRFDLVEVDKSLEEAKSSNDDLSTIFKIQA